MLHSYTFRNFQSFREGATVSLELSDKHPKRGWDRVSASGKRLSTAIGVFGANAAGKTALLKPLAFAQWFLSESFNITPESQIPVTPFFASEDPVEIEIEAEDLLGATWRYVLHATRKRVIHEALYRKQTRFSYVFIRDWNAQSKSYDIRQQGFGFAPAEAKKVRGNASLISTAAQYGVDTALHVAGFSVATNIYIRGRRKFEPSHLDQASEFFHDNDDLRGSMVALLKKLDLGLSDILVRELTVPQDDGTDTTTYAAVGVHQTREGSQQLPMEFESSGTQSAYVLLTRLLWVLAHGGLALIDEMESDLHPHLIEPLLELFADERTNPEGAQLIFTCHSTKVLELLQKSQVYFVEKDKCESSAYRGDEIAGLRADDNLRAKYESGALGAVPDV